MHEDVLRFEERTFQERIGEREREEMRKRI